MAAKPWYTSSDLISAVKRKIAVPINQRTFTEDDILAFANEEMMISQVPDILEYHEEFFVAFQNVLLVANQVRYPIPERALGMKLRDVWYMDTNGNLFEMTRLNPNDKAYWQYGSATSNLMQKYYIEGNEIILAPQNLSSPTGFLQLSYFLRPNQLVSNTRAAICSGLSKIITIDNSLINIGDELTLSNQVINTVTLNGQTFQQGNSNSIALTAVSGSPASGEFQIGVDSAATAANLTAAINATDNYTANAMGNSIQVNFQSTDNVFYSSDPNAIMIDPNTTFNFLGSTPSNIIDGAKIDFLQTSFGHKTLGLSIKLPTSSISTNSMVLPDNIVPAAFNIGDYICEEYECIIPQIPSDLHNGLAERVCGRILAAQGDQAGLQMNAAKLQDIQKSEGMLLDNRVEGSTQKITQRKGLLSFMRMGVRRRI